METQGKKNIIYTFLLFSMVILMFNCQNTKKEIQVTSQEKGLNANIVKSEVIVNQIIKLSNVIIISNCELLKKYFSFPINNQYIWYKVLSDNNLQNTDPTIPFTEKDFNKYYTDIFDGNFKKTLATIDLDILLSNAKNQISSDTVDINNGIYINKCILSINFNDKEVSIELLSNIFSENNEFLSEHIDKYTFTLQNDKLLFSNFEMID